jgi:hypothetical protein
MPTNPVLVKLCRVWNRLTDKLKEMGLMFEDDYRALTCKMEGDWAEMRVGSAEGHMTHVDLKERTIYYYDADDDVNEVMKKLFEEMAGAKCELFPKEGVLCSDVKDFEGAFKAIAFATSMDYRIRYPEDYYGPNFEKLDGACKDVKDLIEREYCAVKKVLEKIGKVL